MYIVGAPHPLKTDAQQWVERLLSERERVVTDAVVLQEILHRYVAINRSDAIQSAFNLLLGIVDEVLLHRPGCRGAGQRNRARLPSTVRARCRDLAVMELHGIDRILSFDTGFDGLPGITRLS